MADIVTDDETGSEEGDETGSEEGDETGTVDVGTEGVALRVFVIEAPVITLPVNGGELSEWEGLEGALEADVEEELESVPEADAEEELEPPRIEVMANAGLAFPESPITGQVH